MDRRLYQYCCLQLIHQFNTPWKYLQQNLDIFLFHSIIGKSIWMLFISNLWLSRCPLHELLTILVHWHSCINIQMLMSGSISESRARSHGPLIHPQMLVSGKKKCLLHFFYYYFLRGRRRQPTMLWHVPFDGCFSQSRLLHCLLYLLLRAWSFL